MSNIMTPTSEHKAFRILGGILVILAIIGVLVLAYTFSARLWKKNQSTENSNNKQSGVAGNVAVGRAKVETDCYVFTIDRTTNFGNRSECDAEVTYGSDGRNSITVKRGLLSDVVTSSTSGADMLNTYRESLSKTVTVESSEQIKLRDGSLAYKYVVRQPGVQQKQAILVLFSPRPVEQYGIKTTPVFIMSTASETDEQKQVIQGVLDSWTWK